MNRIECMLSNGKGNVLVCGCNNGFIVIKELWNLQDLYCLNLQSHGSIKCLWFPEGLLFLILLFYYYCMLGKLLIFIINY
jgi:hypothetical protein